MQYDNLTRAQKRVYHEAVSTSHHCRIELVILTLNDRPVRSLTNRFIDGQVDTDTERTPAAVLQCEILDDDFVLDWESGKHRQFKAQVVDARFVPELDEWVEQVVFTGPLWDFTRSGAQVSLVAQGTERLAMGSVRRVFERPRKAKATIVIRDLLQAAGAVRRLLVIPNLDATLPERVTIGIPRDGKDKDKKKDDKPRRKHYRATNENTYYGEASRIAAALDRLLYADSHGRFVLRSHPARATVKLTDSQLLAPVTVTRSVEGDTVNTWEIRGANPKGPKKQVAVTVAFPKRNELSAQSLAWHSKPHELVETVENEHLKTDKQARVFGRRLRDRALGSLVSYEVESMPVFPWLQPHMMISVPTEGGRALVRATRWTHPLGRGGSATLGANRRKR